MMYEMVKALACVCEAMLSFVHVHVCERRVAGVVVVVCRFSEAASERGRSCRQRSRYVTVKVLQNFSVHLPALYIA